MILEIARFIIYSGLIVIISKYILVKTLRKLAENLDLKSKTVGNIAGYATSMPELLTITTSSVKGLMGASIYNVLSSNIINLIQYIASVIMNKNKKAFYNKAIKIDIILVIITIIIPIILIWRDIEINLFIIPTFIIAYILFLFLNNNAHKLYLENENKQIEKNVEREKKKEKGNTRKTLLYSIILILAGISLFIISQLLGESLNNLCRRFNISQIIIGIFLGCITSIPELITFLESQKHHKKKNNNILGVVEATNNLLTSNLLNLFVIQSVGIIIYSILY